MTSDSKLNEDDLLLKNFNGRDSYAFGMIYSNYFNEFHLYASSLYANTSVNPSDAVQDAFMYIWQNKNLTFEEILKLKAFVIIAIKNRYKNHLDHLQHEKKYHNELKLNIEFEIDIMETTIYTYVEEGLGLLPEECAKVFKLYLEGWKPEEISLKLDKSIQTVYNTKQRAISILKQRFPKDRLLLILSYFNIV